MARYINFVETIFSKEEIDQVVEQTMKAEGFKKKIKGGEEVWQKGGLLTGPQFVKVVSHNGKAEVHAWLKFALLPGVYFGEMDLTGAMGFAIKDVLRKRIAKLEQNIKNDK
ncbi:MAG: hypothetical protein AB1Z23_12755 [Eubacteriales bacterium]